MEPVPDTGKTCFIVQWGQGLTPPGRAGEK